ncbi:MAG: DUF3488 domain-containing protein, partial [Acinetobacter sp.]|nr:DUF3488 domain-containing protein [Acinetobacter sp.]
FNTALPLQLKRQNAETVSVWMNRLSQQVQIDQQSYFQLLRQRYEQYVYMQNGVENTDIDEIIGLLKTCSSVLKKL